MCEYVCVYMYGVITDVYQSGSRVVGLPGTA